MSFLSTLTTDSTIADEKDSVGGGSKVLDTNVYKFAVKHAYIIKADSEAIGLVLNLKTEEGVDLRQTLWMTSGKAKGCKNYYEKDGVKSYLPGFILANSLCLLTLGKEISQLETEQKVIPLYNYEAKSEIPTKVDMIVDLIGAEILGAVVKQIVDKTKKNEATGVYEATGETREENEIDKFFRERDGMTTAEIRAKVETASFINSWKEKWIGEVKNKAKGTGTAGKAGNGMPATKASSTKPTTSLFG